MSFPKILSRTRTRLSPWVEVIEKLVQFEPGKAAEAYHFMSQAPYIGVLARTPDGRIALVRQFRPAVEAFTWEFPAGTIDPGESPEQTARRELLEETGLETLELVHLGEFYPDTGRLQILSHMFYARTGAPPDAFAGEPGLTVRYVTHNELKGMIAAGEFRYLGHLALYAAVLVRGIDLG